jgi:hypothetical protein
MVFTVADGLYARSGILVFQDKARSHRSASENGVAMSAELNNEIAIRVENMRSDPHFMEDNENPAQAELEVFALEDLVSMEDDFGGAFRSGIYPTIYGANGQVDKQAMQRQAEFKAQQAAEHKAWRKLWREAKRELAKRKSAHVAERL